MIRLFSLTENGFHCAVPALLFFFFFLFLCKYFLTRSRRCANGVPPVRQDDPSQGDLGTLANVVTSLGQLNKSSDDGNDLMGVETLSNGDSSMTDIQGEEQSASDITR